MNIHLEQSGLGYGITVRGGYSDIPSKSRPLVITHIRPGSPAARLQFIETLFFFIIILIFCINIIINVAKNFEYTKNIFAKITLL